MNYSEAKRIHQDNEAREHWMELDERVREDLMDLIDWYDERQMCCEPYDCMCHELCSMQDDVANTCSKCQAGAKLHESTIAATGAQYQFALALREIGQRDLQAYELETIKMLEESGDHAGAARMFYGEDQ